jgi:hypothetical protein
MLGVNWCLAKHAAQWIVERSAGFTALCVRNRSSLFFASPVIRFGAQLLQLILLKPST